MADPLGGSYFIEALSSDLESRAWGFLEEIEQRGGFITCLETGFLQQVAAENQVDLEHKMTTGDRQIVGVNFSPSDHDPFNIDGFAGSIDAWDRGMERLARLRSERDTSLALEKLRDLTAVCQSEGNVMAGVLEAVGADATVGEIGDVFREVYGSWKFPINF